MVRKSGDAQLLALEAEKTTRAAALGARTGLFRVPAVVRWDPAEGVLETERVRGFRSLEQLAIDRDERLPRLCARAGEALAAVHAELRLPSELHLPLPLEPAGYESERVCVHGDFNGANVGYDRTCDELVIVDWSSAPALGGPGTLAHPYFDLVWFGFFFYRFQPLRSVLRWRPGAWLDAVVGGYAGAGLAAFHAQDFEAYREAWSPFLLADYRAQCSRRGRSSIRRPLYWIRARATWGAWRAWRWDRGRAR